MFCTVCIKSCRSSAFIWSWHLPIQTSLSEVIEGGFYEVICMIPMFFWGFHSVMASGSRSPLFWGSIPFQKLSVSSYSKNCPSSRRDDPLRLCPFASLNGGLLFLWIHIPKQHPTTSELIWISPDQLLVSTVQYRTLVATVRKGCGHLLKKILALLAELKYSPKSEQP